MSPVESPTVPNADTVSNAIGRMSIGRVVTWSSRVIAEHERDRQQRDRQRAVDDDLGHAPAERLRVRAAEDGRHDRRQQDRERRQLDAAAGRARGRADEHQRDADEQARAGELADRDRRHPGGAERDRLEQRVERAAAQAAARRASPGSTTRRRAGRASRRRRGRWSSRRPASSRARGGSSRASPNDVAHDRDAEAAEHDQHRERHEDQRVARKRAQAVEVRPSGRSPRC